LRLLAQAGTCEVHVLTTVRFSAERGGRDCSPAQEVIDGVHVHRVDSDTLLLPASFRLARKHRFDLLHGHNLRPALLGHLGAPWLPLIVELHASPKSGCLREWCYRRLHRRAAGAVALSPALAEELIDRYRLDSSRVAVVRNGVNLSAYARPARGEEVRRRHGLEARQVVGYVGSLYRWQGVYDLVQASVSVLRQEPQTRFLIAGHNPDHEQLVREAQRLGVSDRVLFPGRIAPEEVPDYLAALDIFVIPRPSTPATETAIPLKVVEAMAAGKAIVATRVGGLTAVLENDRTALLAEPGNPEALADTILTLLRDPERRESLGSNARATVSNSAEWSWETASGRLLRFYNTILGTNG